MDVLYLLLFYTYLVVYLCWL